jgi:hypothetical protein
MEDLNAFLAHFCHVHLFDESDDLAKGPIHIGNIGTHLADSQDGTLPEVLPITLSNRYVERIRDTCLDLPDDPALALQGMVLRQEERQLEDPNDHGSQLSSHASG